MGIKIGSFNMYKFNFRSDAEISKNIGKIVEIIKGEDFDILALQEVFNETVISRCLMPYLGDGWDYRWDCPISRSKQAAEGYAYLWKKTKFRLATGLREGERSLELSKLSPQAKAVFEARIQANYKQDKMLYQGRLVRDPFYARFESLQGWFEIRLINTHIMFSDNSDDSEVALSDAAKRTREFQILTEIYRQLADKQYRSSRPAYTILLGDYNLNLNRTWTKAPYLEEIIESKDRNGQISKCLITIQDQLTTLKGRSSSRPDESARGYANNYDHFTYDKIRFDGIAVSPAQRIDTVRKYYADNFELHRKEISDHIPICMEIELRTH